ncbi:hypothetical protein TVNIR_0005 [Thioalkalivibrio nitratireducens DSM 14787]|uniref:DUF4351 domain-containing protein n=1 Tax=Thioalkalivibrio nitratireducens (strain DSM 14787 / UNIQEM 213 / ALEN2) TaxID=1255043 RepID=L0DRV0_THIND|nr:DUF4351 domain-containing protein [Thioalkalivibrio nitratireducens]AGA31720.1 hypothetical protein TVNIR_0005 [Thioalkalivibrio nitratireducens DSM 14787]
MTHDQNFKNLILDYPREAIALFAAAEAQAIDADARVTPVRQEQLQERLGERFRELDIPLLVEWPDGRREAILFVIEEETEPARFSVHRLAHYCLDLSELLHTQRVVPVVVFLHRGDFSGQLSLGGDADTYLDFRFLAYALPRIPAREHFESPNLVARLNLPNMAYGPEEKLEVYAQAMRGLTTLEPDPERRIKYLDFIDIYAALDENERIVYRQRYPEEVAEMTRFAERFLEKGRDEGREQGLEQGIGQGEARVLLRQLTLKFGPLPEPVRARIESADADTLLRWSERVLSADQLDEVFSASE